ncbi:hypothetical protein QIA31_05270 (plasmid) [Borreliella turdi]|uniref:hypothetical protein n=1 Tax=Borreliella turdi TaxID=57863 RepID=UPI003AF0D025
MKAKKQVQLYQFTLNAALTLGEYFVLQEDYIGGNAVLETQILGVDYNFNYCDLKIDLDRD